ncbi:MAG: thioredoxin domain-containing protein [Planctomycetaceae bacterium]|nr:thioredoxin domain-containing protein [Planctomycetaceae bacterium]
MNRLAHETSPYLLQHANNPVDWHPWGAEAIGLAKQLDRPIFLSIGYSACHWCHVMEHESFENAEIAALLNADFISIKVDREERPDLDQIYMNAVQVMTGRGGWPMSVFLTPDLRPFYGGTYFPPASRYGMPGFGQVLQAVADAWKTRRDAVQQQAGELTSHLHSIASEGLKSAQPLPPQLLPVAVGSLERAFDHQHGGFGGAPKFPHPMDLRVLLREHHHRPNDRVLAMVTHTFDKMAAGGIYDQLGGGFHRYSVDERWLVPHFEKMLYDNALLVVAYLEAWQATGRDDYRRVVRETCDYILREMTDPAGGFYSTQDADSEGVEGKFYVWTPAEIEQILGVDRGQLFCRIYDVTPGGNFEHANILNLPKSLGQMAALLSRDLGELTQQLSEDRAKLLAMRNQRIWPGLDDKVLTSWNGLMIDGMAQAGAVLDEPRYVEAAAKAAAFILKELRRDDGRLLHSWRRGQAKFDAYLDDYAGLVNALVSLYEATFDETWITEAATLADTMLALFHDAESGGFFYTAVDHEQLITRQKDVQDSSTPSGNALAATALVRLGKLCGRDDYFAAAERTLQVSVDFIQRAPSAAGQSLIAASMVQGPTQEVALVGDRTSSATQAVLRSVRQRFWPDKVVALRPSATRSPQLDPLFVGKPEGASEPTLFICEGFACQAPLTGLAAIEAELQRRVPRTSRP